MWAVASHKQRFYIYEKHQLIQQQIKDIQLSTKTIVAKTMLRYFATKENVEFVKWIYLRNLNLAMLPATYNNWKLAKEIHLVR